MGSNPTGRIVKAIRRHLTPDLLKPRYRGQPHPMAGHCYVAAETCHHLLKKIGIKSKPVSGRHEGVSHWWLLVEGRVVDPTADQFSKPVDYLTRQRSRLSDEITKPPSSCPHIAGRRTIMSNVYVVMGETVPGGWKIIRAWCSKRLAIESAEKLMSNIESNNRTIRSVYGSWKFWEKATRAVMKPPMPIEFITVWKANCVGGGNRWSSIAVAELIVEGTILDELTNVVAETATSQE